jgi:hypothetical protein
MASRADTFNRSDGALNGSTPSDAGGTWTATVGNFQISSNALVEISGNLSDPTARLDCGSADAEVAVTLAAVGTSGRKGVAGRIASDTSNIFFLWDAGTNELKMWKNDGGGFTQLGSTVGYTASNGDVMKLTFGGDTINAYVNDVLKIGPITDSFNNTVTNHGVYIRAADGSLDDFSITVGGAAGQPAAKRMGGVRFGPGFAQLASGVKGW